MAVEISAGRCGRPRLKPINSFLNQFVTVLPSRMLIPASSRIFITFSASSPLTVVSPTLPDCFENSRIILLVTTRLGFNPYRSFAIIQCPEIFFFFNKRQMKYPRRKPVSDNTCFYHLLCPWATMQMPGSYTMGRLGMCRVSLNRITP